MLYFLLIDRHFHSLLKVTRQSVVSFVENLACPSHQMQSVHFHHIRFYPKLSSKEQIESIVLHRLNSTLLFLSFTRANDILERTSPAFGRQVHQVQFPADSLLFPCHEQIWEEHP